MDTKRLFILLDGFHGVIMREHLFETEALLSKSHIESSLGGQHVVINSPCSSGYKGRDSSTPLMVRSPFHTDKHSMNFSMLGGESLIDHPGDFVPVAIREHQAFQDLRSGLVQMELHVIAGIGQHGVRIPNV